MSTEAEAIPPPLEPPALSMEEHLANASAGFGIRFLARFVDLLYGLAIGLVTGFGSGIILAILGAMHKLPEDWVERLRAGSRFHMYGFGILGSYVYFALSEGIGGTTIGKLASELRVVQTDGQPCTIAGAFKRDLLYHWDALFIGLIGYASMKDSPTNQRYGDVWAYTVVVKKDRFGLTSPSNGKIVAGIVIGTMAMMLCQFVGLLLKVL
jgi:uncharacterized RDD family membrane protein YckC